MKKQLQLTLFLLFFLAFKVVAFSDDMKSDSLVFTNLKATYCSPLTETITFTKPTTVPNDTRFYLYLGSEKRLVGSTIDSSFEFNLNLHYIVLQNNPKEFTTFFIIESENGKWKSQSKPFIVYRENDEIRSSHLGHCEGFSTTLTYFPTSENSSYKYQWYKDGIPIENETKNKIEVKERGSYYLQVSTQNGCIFDTYSEFIDLNNVSIGTPLGTFACTGFKVPITISNNGFLYTAYEVIKDGKTLIRADSLDTFDVSESGYYKVVGYQGNCYSVSDSVYITIGKLPSYTSGFGYISLDTGILIGDKVIKRDSAISIPMYIYRLYYEDLNKYGMNIAWYNNDKKIQNPYGYGAGRYYAIISQGNCITKTNTLTVEVNSKLLFPLAYNSQKEISVCQEEKPYYLRGSADLELWDKKLYRDGILQTDNSYIQESGSYYAIYKNRWNPNWIAYSDTINVKFTSEPIDFERGFGFEYKIIDTLFTCEDIFRIDFSHRKGEWTFNGSFFSNDTLMSFSKEGLYIFEENKNEKSCPKRYSYYIKKSIPLLISNRNFPDTLVSLSYCNKIEPKKENLFLTINGFYELSRRHSGQVEWYRDNELIRTSNDKDSFVLPISQSGIYRAKLDYNGCKGESNEVKVNFVNFDTSLSPAKDSIGVCPNNDFPTLAAHHDTSYEYQWLKDNKPLQESTSVLKVSETGTYRAFLEKEGCIDVTSPIKIYTSTERPTATLSGDTVIAKGENTNLNLLFTSNPPFSYKLNNGESGTASENAIQHSVVAQENRTYELVSVSNGCGEGTVSGSATILISIYGVLGSEPAWAEVVKIYPVPTTESCSMEFSLEKPEKITYELVSIIGKILIMKELGVKNSVQEDIDLSTLPIGEYLLNLQIGEKRLTRKVIKR